MNSDINSVMIARAFHVTGELTDPNTDFHILGPTLKQLLILLCAVSQQRPKAYEIQEYATAFLHISDQ
jgi:hypothetical protein